MVSNNRMLLPQRKSQILSSITGAALLALTSSATTTTKLPMTSSQQPVIAHGRSLQYAHDTLWHRELQAASEFVSKRRKRRQRRRQLQKYNDYLPEDAPESLLTL